MAERVNVNTVIAELNLTPTQIQAIRDYFAVDVDVLFSGLTVNQRRFLKITQALVKALAKQAIREIR